jgi:hypothetical protein
MLLVELELEVEFLSASLQPSVTPTALNLASSCQYTVFRLRVLISASVAQRSERIRSSCRNVELGRKTYLEDGLVISYKTVAWSIVLIQFLISLQFRFSLT